MESFELPIEQLSESPEHFVYEASPGWWAERSGSSRDIEATAKGPFRFELDARRVREDVLVEGDFEGTVELECGRCTRRYSQPLRDAYRLVLEPVGDREPEDPEGLPPSRSGGSAWERTSRLAGFGVRGPAWTSSSES